MLYEEKNSQFSAILRQGTMTRTGGMSSSQPVDRIIRKYVGEYNQSLNSLRILRQFPIPEYEVDKVPLRNNIMTVIKEYQTKANALYLAILNTIGNKHLTYNETNCQIQIFVSRRDLLYSQFSQLSRSREEPKYHILKNPAKITELVLIQMRPTIDLLDSLSPSLSGHRLPYPIYDYIDKSLPLFSSSLRSRVSLSRRYTRVLPIRT